LDAKYLRGICGYIRGAVLILHRDFVPVAPVGPGVFADILLKISNRRKLATAVVPKAQLPAPTFLVSHDQIRKGHGSSIVCQCEITELLMVAVYAKGCPMV
jgi:hypothetical protein